MQSEKLPKKRDRPHKAPLKVRWWRLLPGGLFSGLSLLVVLSRVLFEYRFIAPIEAVVTAYENLTSDVRVVLEPIMTPVANLVISTLGLSWSLQPHWVHVYILIFLFCSSFVRLLEDWREQLVGYIAIAFVTLLMSIIPSCAQDTTPWTTFIFFIGLVAPALICCVAFLPIATVSLLMSVLRIYGFVQSHSSRTRSRLMVGLPWMLHAEWKESSTRFTLVLIVVLLLGALVAGGLAALLTWLFNWQHLGLWFLALSPIFFAGYIVSYEMLTANERSSTDVSDINLQTILRETQFSFTASFIFVAGVYLANALLTLVR